MTYEEYHKATFCAGKGNETEGHPRTYSTVVQNNAPLFLASQHQSCEFEMSAVCCRKIIFIYFNGYNIKITQKQQL